MEYIILGIIAVPAALLFLFVLALATGAVHEPGELECAARGLRHSWNSLARH